jgi:hypothetical protein
LQVFHLPQDSGKEAQVQQALPEGMNLSTMIVTCTTVTCTSITIPNSDLKMLYSTMKLGLPAETNVEFQATYQIKICSFEVTVY